MLERHKEVISQMGREAQREGQGPASPLPAMGQDRVQTNSVLPQRRLGSPPDSPGCIFLER